MSTLYIDRKHTRLDIKGTQLTILVTGEKSRRVPLALIKHIVISSNVELDTRLLSALSGHGIDLLIINPRQLTHRSFVLGGKQNNAAVRIAQYRSTNDLAWKLNFCQTLLQAKLANHQRFLDHALQERHDLRKKLRQAHEEISRAHANMSHATSLETLRGLEGSAARAFFSAFAALMPSSLEFTGRKRRPPPDPVNAVLSLSYTLLHYRAVKTAWSAGLDPMIGFLHEPSYSRESLAIDLFEPWRPHIEQWVWELFRKQTLRSEDFTTQEGSCLLNKAGRQRFYLAYEQRNISLERALRQQVHQLKQNLLASL